MLVTKISSKGQVTVPKKVRETLGAKLGDWIEYSVKGKVITLRKLESFDRSFHAALSDTMTEWNSAEDEEAFRDL